MDNIEVWKAYNQGLSVINIYRLAEAVATHQEHKPASGASSFIGNAKVAEEQLKVMDLGFSEVVRQVAIQCSERAELMHRMWRASHELYDSLLSEMCSTIDGLRYSASDWKEKCELVRAACSVPAFPYELVCYVLFGIDSFRNR